MGYRSPHGCVLPLTHGNLTTPLDATSYLFGDQLFEPPDGVWNLQKIKVPKTGRIIEVWWNLKAVTTAGSGEPWPLYIRLNDATDYLVDTRSVAGTFREWWATTLNIPVACGDYFAMKYICPTWATNPVLLRGNGYVLIECE